MEDGELVKRETRDDEEDVGRAGPGRAGRKRTRYIGFLQSKASI
jgi:hypothetical protein